MEGGLRAVLDRHMVTVVLAACLFLTGLSSAAIAPYRAVVAVQELGLSKDAYAAVITFNALATALASVVLGRFSDRIGDRRRLVLFSAVMGGLAYGLIWLWPGKVSYPLAFCAILPFGGALFSQSFAFSRAWYDRNAPGRALMMTSVLRTMFSAAWVLVPPAAGWIAARYGVFDVFAFAALGHLGFVLVFALMLRRPDARLPPAPPRPPGRAAWRLLTRRRIVGLAGILGLRTAIMLHLTLLPLAMLNDYHGSYGDVGFTAALAAALEVPFMLAWGHLAGRWRKGPILILNGPLYAAYSCALLQAATPLQVLWLQVPNAIATAALLSLTISYVQDSIKGQIGLSTALMDVITVVSTLATGLAFRSGAADHSYAAGFALTAASALAGSVLLWLAREPAQVAEG